MSGKSSADHGTASRLFTKVMEEADGAPLREEDAADRDARLLAEQAARDEAEFRKRSQAVRRDLPRPG